MQKKLIACILMLAFLLMPVAAYADAAVGDTIVTIGANLNEQQKQSVLKYFNPPSNAKTITVSIDEERRYLGGVVPDAQIGNGTHSCAMVTYTKKGSGISVNTRNINYVTPSAYESALLTAGVTDADVKITAPFEVSGTGALTGIFKAYETSTGRTIDENVKKAATNELVTNADLAKAVGEKTSTNVINDIKKEVATKKPQTDADVRGIVDDVLARYNIQLTEAQYQELLSMIQELANLNIDWNALANNLDKFAKQTSEYLQSEDGQTLLSQLQHLFDRFFTWLQDVFGNAQKNDNAGTSSNSN